MILTSMNSRYTDLLLCTIVVRFLGQVTPLCFYLLVDESAADATAVLCEYDDAHNDGGMCVRVYLGNLRSDVYEWYT